MMVTQLQDQVFVLRGPCGEEEWKAIVDGTILAASFNSRGAAAEAAIPVEHTRRRRRATSNLHT
mgnify:CR=1 FL=1